MINRINGAIASRRDQLREWSLNLRAGQKVLLKSIETPLEAAKESEIKAVLSEGSGSDFIKYAIVGRRRFLIQRGEEVCELPEQITNSGSYYSMLTLNPTQEEFECMDSEINSTFGFPPAP